MQEICDRIQKVREGLRSACAKAGREISRVEIVAVTKTVPVEAIQMAVESGLTILGENRVQELVEKFPRLEGVRWHLIGHLQTNKVKYMADKVDMLHSLDSRELADALSKKLQNIKKEMDVLVQVNVSGEKTKFGIPPEEVLGFIEQIRHLPGIHIKGLMTIAPHVDDPEEVRGVFRSLKQKFEEVKAMNFPGVEMKHLSMGMSNDYKIAVEEGATLIRLGSVIFGKRTYKKEFGSEGGD